MKLPERLNNSLILTTTFYVISILALLCACQPKEKNVTYGDKVSAEEFKALIEKETAPQIVDVRTAEEFQSGALFNATNINSGSLDFLKQIEKLDKSKPVFLYCLSGTRSAGAMNKMISKGFTNVYSMEGGILAWKDKGYPITAGITKNKTGYSPQDLSSLLSTKEVVLVDFYAPWCGPCRAMEPSLNTLTKEFEGKVHIQRINVDESPELSSQMEISSIPLLILFKNGKEVKRSLGLIKEAEIRELMNTGLKNS
jgi:thioredoxin 1